MAAAPAACPFPTLPSPSSSLSRSTRRLHVRAGLPPVATASPREQQSAREAAGARERRRQREEEKAEADAEDLERQRKEKGNHHPPTLSIILRREATKVVLDKREPGKGTRLLLPRTILEVLHDRVVALRWESAFKVFELMRDQVFRSVHRPRPSPRSACCVCIQVKKEEEFSTGPLSLLLMSVKNNTHRTRASWPIKAHGARKRRKEVVRHRHGGGGWARTEEDRAPLFFQVSEQHQEEELKHDHQEAPPQQQMSLSMKRQRLL
ncbi:uncharacterized protein LOC119335911 isoform X2 [Triticum dicoccoides]|uniref:uncharacterized protein LOC119335911 isoform X2 n=2 Tax=Triticum dicoccoides TaxID=85692 RepID=UPI001891D679|nr:uncharacterized protein LOC119335911 isoform X2 [Triticum dicoccoides]